MSKHKAKRARREAKREHHKKAQKSRSVPSANPPATTKAKKQKATTSNPPTQPHVQASQKHAIPFDEYDNILLVGEGDFSFTRSLVIEHGCANVTATSFDSEEDVHTKYPTFAAIHAELRALTPPVPFHHAIDATKLNTYKSLRNDDGPWDTVAFMFPHTGGLSTDVNRQVRANQALLVSFFEACLETADRTKKKKANAKATAPPFLRLGGKVIVTLFEGDPYSLWNIRDLARHTGLKIVESFKFGWGDYPGYKHVRTLGAIEGGGAWKAEDREARMYILEKVESKDSDSDSGRKTKSGKNGRKRGREESESGGD